MLLYFKSFNNSQKFTIISLILSFAIIIFSEYWATGYYWLVFSKVSKSKTPQIA